MPQGPGGRDAFRAGAVDGALQVLGHFAGGRRRHQGVGVLCVDPLVLRDEDLAAFARAIDLVGGDVNPVRDPIRAVGDNDKQVGQPVTGPVVEVVGILFGVPPARDLTRLVILRALEVLRVAGLDLGADEDSGVEPAPVADLQEQVHSQIMCP
jgi:hypothetical protein